MEERQEEERVEQQQLEQQQQEAGVEQQQEQQQEEKRVDQEEDQPHYTALKQKFIRLLAIGKYQRTSTNNYDEFLKALDVKFFRRKAATMFSSKIEVSEVAGIWNIKTSAAFKTAEIEFEVGREFEETTPDGRQVKAVVTQDDNKFILIQTSKKEEEGCP